MPPSWVCDRAYARARTTRPGRPTRPEQIGGAADRAELEAAHRARPEVVGADRIVRDLPDPLRVEQRARLGRERVERRADDPVVGAAEQTRDRAFGPLVGFKILGGVVAVGFLTAVELASHGSRHVEMAIHAMTKGEHKDWFRAGTALGVVVPAVLVIIALATETSNAGLAAVAGVSALVGMWLAETAFVRAGQSVPLS